MIIRNLHTDIQLETKDYFYVAADENDTVKVVLTSGNRHPVALRRISRRQFCNLIGQFQKITLAQDSRKYLACYENEPETKADGIPLL